MENSLNDTKPNMDDKKLCVIRKFRTGDEIMIREIITEATMATVKEFYFAAVFSEVFPQVAVFLFACSFILFGVSFYYSLFGIPASFIVIYVILWMACMFETLDLHSDLNKIGDIYMRDPDCGFWVAEVVEEMSDAHVSLEIQTNNTLNYNYVTGEEFDRLGLKINNNQKRIVGTVAVTKSKHRGMRAWLHRMAVRRTHQRRGIANRLFDEVIQFCTDHGYEGIELATTECHYNARELYMKRGFHVEVTYYKKYFTIRQPMYLFYMKLESSEES